MDVVFHFFVAICVALQVTRPASGLRVPLCNITSKSVPFKAPPNSTIIKNSIPFQIGPPCPKCARISLSNEPHLQREVKKPEETLSSHHAGIVNPSNPNSCVTSPNKILSSSKVLMKTSDAEASMNPGLSELILTPNILKNSVNNLNIPLSNTLLGNSNNVVNPVSGIDTLFSSKNVSAVFQNGFTNPQDTNTVSINTLVTPDRQMDSAIGNIIISQNSPANSRSLNMDKIINHHPNAVNTRFTQFVSPQNVVANNSAVTSLNAINPQNLIFSKYNEASPKSSDFNIKQNSNQNGPVINNQVDFSDMIHKLPIPSVLTNQDTSLSLNKGMNTDFYSKLSSTQADVSNSKFVNIPLDSKVSAPNRVSTSATTGGNRINPKNNIINEIDVVTPNSLNTFTEEKNGQNSIISQTAVDPLLIKKESNFINVNSNNLRLQQSSHDFNFDSQTNPTKTSTIPKHKNILGNNLAGTTTSGTNLQLESLSTPTVPVSLQPKYPNKYFPSRETDNDFNNLDSELQVAILNQLQNPVTITNNEKEVSKTSPTHLNGYNLKPIQPLTVSNNFQIIDFPNFISPSFAENQITSFQTNNFKTTTSDTSPSKLFNDGQNVAQKILQKFDTIPSIETNESEIDQKIKSTRTEFAPQNKLRASSLNTSPLINNSQVNSKLSVPYSVNAIPQGTPIIPKNIAQSSINNSVKPSIQHSLFSHTQSVNTVAHNNLQSSNHILLKPAESASADSTLINKNLKSKIDSTESINQDLIPTNKLYTNSKLYKPFDIIRNNSQNNVPIASVSSKPIFTLNENTNSDIDKGNVFKGKSYSSTNGSIRITPGSKSPTNSYNDVAYKHPNLVSTSPNLEAPDPIQNNLNFIPISDSNSVLSLINLQLPITGSTKSLIGDSHSVKKFFAQNPFIVNTETVNKTETENIFAQVIQKSNFKGAENVIESEISKPLSVPHIIPAINNLPNVYAPQYVQPRTVISYANTLPSVPQISDLFSTSKMISSLNELAAEVIRRYFNLVGQKLNSKPTSSPVLKSIPITNPEIPKIEPVPLFQSNTHSTLPTSSYPFTASDSVTSSVISATPISSINLTELTQSPISPKENEKLTSSSLMSHLSSVTTNIPEDYPTNILKPAYMATVDYPYLPSPIYPVVPSSPFPIAFPAVLPPIIEAPVLRTGCKDSQDFKKILEILVLNELINNKNECKDWGTLQTIIALLCAS